MANTNGHRIESTAKSRVAALIAAGALGASLVAVPLAFAEDGVYVPSAGAQTGTGTTDVTVILRDTREHSGTDDPNNQSADNDGLGDQIAFTVPSEINFVADSEGNLTGPSAEAPYIENESAVAIHASSLQVDSANGWTIIADGAQATAANSVDFQVGPAADMLDAYDYTSKAPVSKPYEWNMAAATSTGTADRVELSSTGGIHAVSQDLTTKTKVAEMHWYVTPGTAAAPEPDPEP